MENKKKTVDQLIDDLLFAAEAVPVNKASADGLFNAIRAQTNAKNAIKRRLEGVDELERRVAELEGQQIQNENAIEVEKSARQIAEAALREYKAQSAWDAFEAARREIVDLIGDGYLERSMMPAIGRVRLKIDGLKRDLEKEKSMRAHCENIFAEIQNSLDAAKSGNQVENLQEDNETWFLRILDQMHDRQEVYIEVVVKFSETAVAPVGEIGFEKRLSEFVDFAGKMYDLGIKVHGDYLERSTILLGLPEHLKKIFETRLIHFASMMNQEKAWKQYADDESDLASDIVEDTECPSIKPEI